jgi:hypothetical protein
MRGPLIICRLLTRNRSAPFPMRILCHLSKRQSTFSAVSVKRMP